MRSRCARKTVISVVIAVVSPKAKVKFIRSEKHFKPIFFELVMSQKEGTSNSKIPVWKKGNPTKTVIPKGLTFDPQPPQ